MIFLLYIIFLSLTGSISTAAPNPASSVHKRQSEDNVVDHCWRKEFRSNKGMYTLVVRPGSVFYDKFSGICFYTVSYRSGLLKKEATITTYHGKDQKFRFDGNAYIELLRSRGDYIDANFRGTHEHSVVDFIVQRPYNSFKPAYMSKDWKKNNVGELLDQAGLGHTCQYTMDRMRDVAMLEVELVARRHRLVLDWGKIKDRGIPAVTMFHFNDDLTQARLIAIFEGFVIPYNGYTIADTLAAVKTQVRDVFPAKPIYLSSDEQVESIRNISPFICMVDYRKFISSSPTAKYYDYDAVIKGMRGA